MKTVSIDQVGSELDHIDVDDESEEGKAASRRRKKNDDEDEFGAGTDEKTVFGGEGRPFLPVRLVRGAWGLVRGLWSSTVRQGAPVWTGNDAFLNEKMAAAADDAHESSSSSSSSAAAAAAASAPSGHNHV